MVDAASDSWRKGSRVSTTPRHATPLLELGCQLAQGYGIARPMSAEALETWMTEWPQRHEWRQLAGQTA